MIRRLLVAGLAAAMLLVIAGCGGGPPALVLRPSAEAAATEAPVDVASLEIEETPSEAVRARRRPPARVHMASLCAASESARGPTKGKRRRSSSGWTRGRRSTWSGR